MLKRAARRLAEKGRAPMPLTRRVGQIVLRAARRNAPVKSGLLRRTLHVEHPDSRRIVLASPMVYAAIQEHGGRIVAGTGVLKAKALAIPISPAARALLDVMPHDRSLRTVQGLFLLKTKRGRTFLARRRRRRVKGKYQDRIEVLFVLRRAVEIPAKHYVVPITHPSLRVDLRRAVAWYMKAGDQQ